MKFASGAAVNAIIPPDPAEIEYYNFGTTETLVSNVAKSIDLTNTGIVNANKKYVVFYGKYVQSDSWNDGSLKNGVKYNSSAGLFFYLGVGDGGTPGFLMSVNNAITRRIDQYYGTRHFKVMLEEVTESNLTKIYTSLANYVNNAWVWPVFNNPLTQVLMINVAKNMTSISTTGLNNGKLTATNFIAKGFDNIEDASAWNPIE
jgi:hypothetical protein